MHAVRNSSRRAWRIADFRPARIVASEPAIPMNPPSAVAHSVESMASTVLVLARREPLRVRPEPAERPQDAGQRPLATELAAVGAA